MKQKLTDLYAKNGTKKVLASLLSILAGLLLGSIVVIIVGLAEQKITTAGMWEGVRLIFAGILSTGRDAAGALTWGFNAQNVGNMLFRAMPLIMTGLSVAVAFKTGLFNIGAPGQYLMGTLVSLSVALGIPSESVPVGIIWLLAFLGGMLAGALWGAIPGLLKALLNINEVLACIMTNWIAANLVTWMFDISSFKNVTEGTKSGYIYKTTFNGVATPKLGLDQLFPGSQVNAGILVAIILAIVVYIIMEKTVFGYELKACGANRHAARYAGIPDKRNIVLSMAIAGALAAAGASLYYLSGNTEFYWSTYQSLPASASTASTPENSMNTGNLAAGMKIARPAPQLLPLPCSRICRPARLSNRWETNVRSPMKGSENKGRTLRTAARHHRPKMTDEAHRDICSSKRIC